MFKVMVPAFIIPSHEVQIALGARLREAAVAAWRELARRGRGFEMAHFQIAYDGVTLAVATGVCPDGCVQIDLAIGDPRQAARHHGRGTAERGSAFARARRIDSRLTAGCTAWSRIRTALYCH